jgi:hypothetical protein
MSNRSTSICERKMSVLHPTCNLSQTELQTKTSVPPSPGYERDLRPCATDVLILFSSAFLLPLDKVLP